jgi:predicted transcriptional regulator
MSKANRTKKTSVLIVITLLLPQLWQPEITFVIRVVSRKKKWKKKRKEKKEITFVKLFAIRI